MTVSPQHLHMDITLSALKARGWTSALVKNFLGILIGRAPILIYSTAAPVQYFAMARVRDAEACEDYRKAKANADRRRHTGKEAADAKRQELLATVRAMQIDICVVTLDDLLQRSLESWRDAARSGEDRNGNDADQATRYRWAVNFARHHLTTYDRDLEKLAGKIGIRDAVDLIREKVYQAIATAYPPLADECRNQQAARIDAFR